MNSLTSNLNENQWVIAIIALIVSIILALIWFLLSKWDDTKIKQTQTGWDHSTNTQIGSIKNN